MEEIVKRHHISFSHAIDGLKWAISTQPNFGIHLSLAFVAIVLGWVVDLSSIEWVLLTFTIVWGLSAELINTAIEAMTDLITKDWKKEAKIAKDVGAGMMFLTAIGTVIVAAIIILPKLFTRFF